MGDKKIREGTKFSRTMPPPKSNVMIVLLTEELLKIDEIAIEKNTSRSAIIRESVNDYLKRLGKN